MRCRQADRERILQLGGLHTENIAHGTAVDIDLTETENIGNKQLLAIEFYSARHRELAAGELAQGTASRVERLHAVVCHVGNINRALRRNGEVIDGAA